MAERKMWLDKNRSELVGIQILRGLAASLVVFHHALEESRAVPTPPRSPDWLTTFGASGVDIFFVISGFIMLYTSFPRGREPLHPLQFLKRRATRLYPFYWVCLASTLSIWAIGFLRHHMPTAEGTLRDLLLLPNTQPIVGVSWTLQYEIFFYVAFGLSLAARSQVLSAAITCGALAAATAVGAAFGIAFLNNSMMIEFCFGIGLAMIFYRYNIPTRLTAPALLIGFALLCVSAIFVPHPSTNGLPFATRWAAWGLPAALIVFSALAIEGKWAASRLTAIGALAGDASYAIYLTHPFVMLGYSALLKRLNPVTAQLPFAAIVFIIALGVGVAAHILVERPLIASTRSLLRRAQ
jgi:exopolysaccharide production protein ExoZ